MLFIRITKYNEYTELSSKMVVPGLAVAPLVLEGERFLEG